VPISERDRRTLKIGGGIAGGLIVIILLLKVVGGGGGDEVAGGPLPSLPGSSESPSLTPSPTTPPPVGVTGRDPFSVPPIFGSTTTSTSTTSPTGTQTQTTSTSTTTTTSTQSSSGQNPSRAVLGGHTVILLDTFIRSGTEMAQVEVDGTAYTVIEGHKFAAGDFTLQSVSGEFATILFGDESATLRAQSPK
jgi:hypothetical protein